MHHPVSRRGSAAGYQSGPRVWTGSWGGQGVWKLAPSGTVGSMPGCRNQGVWGGHGFEPGSTAWLSYVCVWGSLVRGLGPANEQAECARMVTGAVCIEWECVSMYLHSGYSPSSWSGAVVSEASVFRCLQLGRLGSGTATECLSPDSGGLPVVCAHFPLTGFHCD